MFPPTQTEAPAELPVSLSDAKANLRVVHSSDDTLISAMLAAAITHMDGYSGILGRCMITSSWEQKFEGWGTCHRLPLPNVDPDSVEIKYLDADEAEQTLDPSMYEVLEDSRGAYIRFRKAFDSPTLADDRAAPVTVTFDAGYGDVDNVPPALKHAIKLIVSDLYDNRGNTVVGDVKVTEMPIAADRLIAPYRRVGL